MANRKNASLAAWALTPGGLELALSLCRRLPGVRLHHARRLPPPGGFMPDQAEGFGRLSEAVSRHFNAYDGHIFIMSTGIVVRTIAPLLKSKISDPAVVVIDETGRHAVSLVSGHIGGANALALSVARAIGADPVITTATDINQLPAVDVIAVEKNLTIENPAAIRHVSMALLERKPVGLHDPFSVLAGLLPNTIPICPAGGSDEIDTAAALRQPAVFVDDRRIKLPARTLVLRPPSLCVGVGCNRGTGTDEIREFILMVLETAGLSPASMCRLASVDLKSDEKGLLSAAQQLGVKLAFFNRDQLNSVTNIQTPSLMAQKHIGVKSVCEAAALMSAGKGTLIVPKQKTPNVTVAVVRKNSIS